MEQVSVNGVAQWLGDLGDGSGAAGAALTLLIGFLAAMLAGSLARRLVRRLARVAQRRGAGDLADGGRTETLVARAVFAIVLVVFAMGSTELLGLRVITAWLSGIASYLPRLLVAVLIIVIGLVGGRLIRRGVARAGASSGVAYAHQLGRAAQAAIVLATMLVAVEQLGIHVTFVTTLLSIFVAATVGAAALAFGLGGRLVVANILAGHYVRKLYEAGQVVRIDGIEGRIVRILPTVVILHTGDEEVAVPAEDFARLRSTLVARGS